MTNRYQRCCQCGCVLPHTIAPSEPDRAAPGLIHWSLGPACRCPSPGGCVDEQELAPALWWLYPSRTGAQPVRKLSRAKLVKEADDAWERLRKLTRKFSRTCGTGPLWRIASPEMRRAIIEEAGFLDAVVEDRRQPKTVCWEPTFGRNGVGAATPNGGPQHRSTSEEADDSPTARCLGGLTSEPCSDRRKD